LKLFSTTEITQRSFLKTTLHAAACCWEKHTTWKKAFSRNDESSKRIQLKNAFSAAAEISRGFVETGKKWRQKHQRPRTQPGDVKQQNPKE
jgi:hypothetical protein